MNPDTHDEQRAKAAIGLANLVGDMAAEVRRKQSEFLATEGLTWEVAAALPQPEKDRLQRAWDSYRKAAA